ncbi:MAG: GNAT family N-acetyltransferase, partial [Pseudomonadota bacterium]
AGRLRTWAIYQDGALIGGMGADRELGYWLTPTAWGHGFATEAGRAVVAEMFADPIVEVVQSSHFVENTASRNVLYKLGFEDACGHVHHSKARGEDVPGRTVLLTRTRWEARQDG